MASTNTAALAERFIDGQYEQGLADVLRGLLFIPRQLSHTWLYDERGSRLFEKLCEVPEYYVTRLETQIMQQHAAEMAALLGDELSIIEYGSGNSQKVRPLLDALPRLRNYVPIDIAASSLARTTRAMRRDYPSLNVLPLCADFVRRLELPLHAADGTRRLIYFPGSTLGNYERLEAVRLLSSMRALAGTDGKALIGIDLLKDRAVLERAYDDERGVTAEFNLNALRHVNRRLGIGFDISHFRHRALWVESQQRIEMHLVSSAHQTIRMGAAVIRLLRGEFIRTECCHKYTPDAFAILAAEAGWRVQARFSDERGWFAVMLLNAA
ncbi:MAG TPA: L-histidine N(alpha)-methyltransferase [Steroidobacteraceae bacterium]|jgi:dimethylhistidine N-methyltransferase|nr:L-histidine N(alpha)-methyltransferase [Steroidobacteraceae bacterium]